MNAEELKQQIADLYEGFEQGEFVETLEAVYRLEEIDELKRQIIIKGLKPEKPEGDSYNLIHLKGLLARKDYLMFDHHLKVYIETILSYR